jgi:hypothetical protein
MNKNTEEEEEEFNKKSGKKIIFPPTIAVLISMIRLIEQIANLCIIIINHTEACNKANFFFIHSNITTTTTKHTNSLLLH